MISNFYCKRAFFYILYILFFNVHHSLLAQKTNKSENIDSLMQGLKLAKEDTSKVVIYTELALEHDDEGNVKEAIANASKAIELCKKVNFKTGEARANHVMGRIYTMQGNYNIALSFYKRSVEIKQKLKDIRGVAATNNNIASVYVYQGNFPDALAIFLNNLKIREQLNDQIGIAEALNNIGNVYVYLNEYQKALKYLRKSLKLKYQIGDQEKIANSINNIATVLCYQDSFTTSLEYYQQALAINTEIGNKKGISLSYNNIANLYTDIHEYKKDSEAIGIVKNIEFKNISFKSELDSAILLHLKALDIQKQIGDNATRIYSLMGIGKCFHLKNNFIEAEHFYKKAYELADSLKAIERQKGIAKNLVDVYTNIKDFKSALEWQTKYEQHKDSLFNEEKTAEITRTEMSFEFEKKEAIAKVEQHKRDEIALKESNIQKLFILLISIGFILVLLFAIYVFKSLKIRNAQNIIISDQKRIVELKQKEIIDSITYAKNIQNAMLPSKEKWSKLLPHSFILYLPKDIVAGDFYWTVQVEQFIFIAAADCTGHGVPGAMVSVVCNNALNRAISEFNKRLPGEILNKTRDLVIESFSKSEDDIKDGMDISLVCIDTKNNSIFWSGANNPLWIYRNKDKKVDEIKANKQPIGIGYGQLPFTTHEISLTTKDTIYLFTDGYADQFGGEFAKKMTKKKFRELILEIGDKPLSEQFVALNEFHITFKAQHEQIDDICVIGIQMT